MWDQLERPFVGESGRELFYSAHKMTRNSRNWKEKFVSYQSRNEGQLLGSKHQFPDNRTQMSEGRNESGKRCLVLIIIVSL